MKRTPFRFLAAASVAGVLLFAAARVESARRPRYGGTLRVEMHAAVSSLDPVDWPADPAASAAKEKLMSLVFDRLTRLDANGHPQPALATSWQHDATSKNWTFQFRQNVRSHDGALLTPADVIASLQSANPTWHVGDISAEYGKNGFDFILVDTPTPTPDLPALLAAARYSIFRRSADGSLIGTGPFRIAEWQPGRRAVFTAFDDNWEGRPYLDSIEVQMGRSPRDQMIDLQVGKADLVEVPPEQARRAAESGARVWSSQLVELLAVDFVAGRPAAEDARLREALSRSIDRGALANFVLQKGGEPAGSLLPQSLSGYAFLFSAAPDTVRARELFQLISPVPPPLVLGYDASDPLERAVAERIAVNARDAGILVNPKALTNESENADARLQRMRIDWSSPHNALARIEEVAGLPNAVLPAEGSAPEELYASERAIVDTFRVIPLVHLPEVYGLSVQVRNWAPASAAAGGDLRLADVWLDLPAGDTR
jgi:peptide/nickel transport system substrate-binding protein